MSKERYRRNIELMILRLTKEVRETLDRHGIDYDLYARKAEVGLERSAFIVYAPRIKLYGLVKKRKTQDIQITIQPISKSSIEFIPLGKKAVKKYIPNRYLFVGVDPGISTGVAVLDINRKMLMLNTRRWLSRNQLIKEISSLGRILVIATDVSPPPLYVKKLASSLNAILYVPEHDLTINEKKELVSSFVDEQKYPLKIKDTHQRDALAAVLKAYNSYSSKFEKAEKELEKLEIELPTQEIKALIVKGYTIHNAIRKISEKYLIPSTTSFLNIPRDKKFSQEEVSRIVKKLTEENLRLKHINEKLITEKKELEYKLLDTEEALHKVLSIQGIEFRKTRLYESLIKRIQGLEEEHRKLKEKIHDLNLTIENLSEYFIGYIEGRYVVVYPLGSFNHRIFSPENKIIMTLENTISLDYLEIAFSKIKPRAIIAPSNIIKYIEDTASKNDIPIIHKENLYLIKIGDYYLVDKEKFEIEYRKSIEKINTKKENLELKIKKILEDYRRRRIKELDEIKKD